MKLIATIAAIILALGCYGIANAATPNSLDAGLEPVRVNLDGSAQYDLYVYGYWIGKYHQIAIPDDVKKYVFYVICDRKQVQIIDAGEYKIYPNGVFAYKKNYNKLTVPYKLASITIKPVNGYKGPIKVRVMAYIEMDKGHHKTELRTYTLNWPKTTKPNM